MERGGKRICWTYSERRCAITKALSNTRVRSDTSRRMCLKQHLSHITPWVTISWGSPSLSLDAHILGLATRTLYRLRSRYLRFSPVLRVPLLATPSAPPCSHPPSSPFAMILVGNSGHAKLSFQPHNVSPRPDQANDTPPRYSLHTSPRPRRLSFRGQPPSYEDLIVSSHAFFLHFARV